MGMRLIDLVVDDPELELAAALECSGHPSLGLDAGEGAGKGKLGIGIAEELAAPADAMIDFSAPESTVARARTCAESGVALVVGTTGLTDEQLATVQEAAKTVPCLISPNMSVGVNLVFDVAALIAKRLGEDYDIEVVETHHRFKKDAPSGTARRIADCIAEATGRSLANDAVYGREGIVGERPKGQIGVHAVRCGDVVGDHVVTFGTIGERIELVHRAHTRDTFARGALRVARFLAGKPAGLSQMADVLGA